MNFYFFKGKGKTLWVFSRRSRKLLKLNYSIFQYCLVIQLSMSRICLLQTVSLIFLICWSNVGVYLLALSWVFTPRRFFFWNWRRSINRYFKRKAVDNPFWLVYIFNILFVIANDWSHPFSLLSKGERIRVWERYRERKSNGDVSHMSKGEFHAFFFMRCFSINDKGEDCWICVIVVIDVKSSNPIRTGCGMLLEIVLVLHVEHLWKIGMYLIWSSKA